MSNPARFQLTIKDANILEVMLQRHGERDGPFARLLRRKLSAATMVFQDAVDPRTATINSRIRLGVDGGPPEERLLAYGGEDAFPDFALPITTLRGLALLGLTAPGSILSERLDGSTEELRLYDVLHQPEAARTSRLRHTIAATTAPRPEPSILAFAARRSGDPQGPGDGRSNPDGDDPGPKAA